MGRDRRNAQLLLIRRRRTTAGMNTTVLRISYLLQLLRSTLRKSNVIQTSEEHQLSLQVTKGNNEYSGHHQMTKDGNPMKKTLIRSWEAH